MSVRVRGADWDYYLEGFRRGGGLAIGDINCDFWATNIAGTVADPPIADRYGTRQLLLTRIFLL